MRGPRSEVLGARSPVARSQVRPPRGKLPRSQSQVGLRWSPQRPRSLCTVFRAGSAAHRFNSRSQHLLYRFSWNFQDLNAHSSLHAKSELERCSCRRVRAAVALLLGPGTWDLAPGTWHLGPQTRDLAPGTFTLDLTPGTLHLGSCTWDLAPGSSLLGPCTDLAPGTLLLRP